MDEAWRLDWANECVAQQALTVVRRQQAKSSELRAAMSLGRLGQQQGKRDKARHLLAEVCGWFTEGLDTVDLQEARALLKGVGAIMMNGTEASAEAPPARATL